MSLSESQTSHLYSKGNNSLLIATEGSYEGQMWYLSHQVSVLNANFGIVLVLLHKCDDNLEEYFILINMNIFGNRCIQILQ